MRYLALLAAGAAAANALVNPNDTASAIEDIINGLYSIGNGTAHLTDLIAGYKDPTDAGNILVATQELLAIIKTTDTTVNNTQGPLNINNATALISPTQNLVAGVQKSINATIDQQSKFYAVGLGLEVRIQLEKIQAVSTPLTNDLVALVPSTLQSVAQSLSTPIKASLQAGIDAYSNATGVYPDKSGASSASAYSAFFTIAIAGLAIFALL